MEEFPPNSQKARAASEQPQVKRVTSADVRRKDGLGQKFKRAFFGGDAKGAAKFVAQDVILPSLRDMMADAGREAVDRLIYGDTTRRRSGGGSITSDYGAIAGRTNYQGMSTKPKSPTQTHSVSRSSRARHDFGEIVIPTRQEANEVIDQMFEICSMYGRVTVADMFAMVDIRAEHTDQKWGWTNLKGAKPERHSSGGWMLGLPRVEQLA